MSEARRKFLEKQQQLMDQMISPRYEDSGRVKSSIFELPQSYVFGPARRAISEYQQGKGLLDSAKAGYEQMGKDPMTAPEYGDLALQAGAGPGVATAVDMASNILEPTMPGVGLGAGIAGTVKSSKAAQKILDEISTAEQATKLSGPARERYLKALDEVYGDRAKRAKEMGFGKKTWFHGSSYDIEKFDPEFLGKSTNAGSAKQGFFFASDPRTASDYADLGRYKGVVRPDVAEKIESKGMRYSDVDELRNNWRHLLSTAESNKKYRNSIKGWEKNKNADWVVSSAKREGLSPDEFVSQKIEKLKSYIRPIPKKQEVLNAKKAYEDGWTEYVSTENEMANKLSKHYIDGTYGNKEELDLINRGLEIGNERNMAAGQNVLPVRLKGKPLVKDYEGQGYRDEKYADLMTSAKEKGHDSVLFKNTYDPADKFTDVENEDIAAVFEPNQIRSINAAYDPRFKDSPLLMAGGLGGVNKGQAAKAALLEKLMRMSDREE